MITLKNPNNALLAWAIVKPRLNIYLDAFLSKQLPLQQP
jgi:hypothetical protein